ncbi:MAG: hypothetical protein IJA12_01245 [Oscillospiraceae bacterium]|nr:hypothetical protein [Oscillospiraceae bacterium]
MKNILSYWDVLLGMMAIAFGIYRSVKYRAYKKERDTFWIFNPKEIPQVRHRRRQEDRAAGRRHMALIVFGALFIYCRIFRDMPNIVTLFI